MKNIVIILLCAAFAGIAACGEKSLSENKVPDAVRMSFQKKFSGVSVDKWEMEGEDEYEAEFKTAEKEMSASFHTDGTWIETETEIEESDLSESVKLVLENEFAVYKIEELSEIESAEYGNGYEVELEKGEENIEVLFSENGEVLHKAMEQEDKD